MILTRRISQCIILTNSSCQMARSLKITRHFSLSSHKKCGKSLDPYDVGPSLENNNNKLEPKKDIELQDRLAELKNDHIKTDSMVRLYTKDKNSSELSTSLTDQTYPSGLAASQQASPSGTLTGRNYTTFSTNLKKFFRRFCEFYLVWDYEDPKIN